MIVEIPADMWNEEVPEPLNYTPVLRTRYGADPVHVKASGGAVGRRQAAGDLCRPGRALRASLAATKATGRAARHSRHHKPRRQVILPGDAPAFARLGRPGRAARGAEIPRRGRRDFRHRMPFTETSFGIAMPKGKTIIHATLDPDASQQGRRGQNRAGWRCRAGARCAAGGNQQERQVRPRHDGRRGRDRRVA